MQLTVLKDYLGNHGHVHHASYERLFDSAFEKYLWAIGLSFEKIEHGFGLLCVQRLHSIEYISPLYLDDRVDIETSVESVGTTSFVVVQQMKRSGQVTTTIRTVYVATRDSKKTPIPESLSLMLKGQGSD